MEAGWRIYAPVDKTVIGSDNGLSSIRRQTIIWTNASLLLNGSLKNKQTLLKFISKYSDVYTRK